MPNDINFQPKPEHTISSTNQAKAYVHHLRMQIIGMLTANPMTVSQVAKQFSVHPANITHHFKLLEKAGLIKLVEKRDIGRTTEKYYRAVAMHFNLHNVDAKTTGNTTMGLSLLRDDLSMAIDQLNEQNHATTALLWNTRIDSEVYQEFHKKLFSLVEQYKQQEGTEGVPYSLCLGLYPNRLKSRVGKIHLGKKRVEKNRSRR